MTETQNYIQFLHTVNFLSLPLQHVIFEYEIQFQIELPIKRSTTTNECSQHRVVSTMTKLWPGWSGSQFPAEATGLPLLQNVHTSSWSPPSLLVNAIQFNSVRVKWPRWEVHHSPPSRVKVNNWNYTSTLCTTFMVWAKTTSYFFKLWSHSLKHRVQDMTNFSSDYKPIPNICLTDKLCIVMHW